MNSDTPDSLRVFIVENDADTLNAFRLFLENLGHTVFRARNYREAMERIPLSDCNVLISDIGLRDGDGWDLLRNLWERNLHCPDHAIAVSGFGTASDRAKSKAAGFRHHLLKPFDPDQLEAMLHEAAREIRLNGGAGPLGD